MISMTQAERKIPMIGYALDPDLLIRHALERGLIAEAGAAIYELITSDPEHPEGWFLKGVHSLLRGDHAHAAGWFDAALARGAASREARLGRAQALLGAERAPEAWDTLIELVQDEPGDHEVMHWLLRTGTALERWEDLAARLEDHLQVRPDDHAARFAYAGVSLRLGYVDVARHHHGLLCEHRASVPGLEDLTRLLDPEPRAASAA